MDLNGQLPPLQLVRGLEHPLRCVRDFSLRVLSTRPALNAGHSDRVWRSLDRYGIDEAFSHFYQVTEFQCTEPILLWLLEKSTTVFGLAGDRRLHSKYCWDWIALADLALLKRYEHDIMVASNRWNESDLQFLHFVTAIEDIKRRFQNEILPEQVRWEKAVSIVETMDVLEGDSSFDEFPRTLVDRTHTLLRPKLVLPESKQAALTAIRNSRDWEESYWMNGFLISATGLMGLEDSSAIDFLFYSLSDDVEYYNDEVASSLARLGSQELIEEFRNRYIGSDYIPRLYMSDVTERVYAPWAADYCRDLLALEDDDELRPWLANALADQCMPQDMELLRSMVVKDMDDVDNSENIELHEKLEILTELFRDDFDANNPKLVEIDARIKSIQSCTAGLIAGSRRCPDCGGYHSSEFHDMDDMEDLEELDDFEDDEGSGAAPVRPHTSTRAIESGPTTVRNTVRVSRNSACPCGSGKKYKKCCMRK